MYEPTFQAHVRRSSPNEAEWCPDMDFHDDVVCVIWHCVEHTVVREPGWIKMKSVPCLGRATRSRTVVDDVIEFAIFSVKHTL